jgi:hypothetical protein
VYVGPALRYCRVVKETVFNVNDIAVIVARFITKLPVTVPNVYPEPGVIDVIFVGYTYVPAAIKVLGVPVGAGLAGVPVSVYACAEPVYVTVPLITTFCDVTAVKVIVHS